MTPTTSAGRFAALGLFLLACALLALHAAYYWPFLSDDALISLRYAERFIEGRGLTWNDGERVEGYSNLLFVLATSCLGAIGVPLVAAARVVGALGMAAAIGAVIAFFRPRDLGDVLPAAAGSLALASSGSFAIWAIGGLEQPLLVSLFGWALVLLVPIATALADASEAPPTPRALLFPGGLLALACLCRPDAPLLALGAGAALWAAAGLRVAGLRAALVLGLLPVLAVAGQLAFRFFYYGDLVPNPAHQKLALSAVRLATGYAYVRDGLIALAPLAALGTIGLGLAARSPMTRPRAWLIGLPLLLWLSWVIVIGGDIFPGRRHLVVPVFLLALGFGEGVVAAPKRASGRSRLAAALVVGIALGANTAMQMQLDRTHRRARTEVPWSKRGEALGRALGSAFADRQPLVASTAAGALPFYSKLPALDMLGLNDRYLAEHPPENLGAGRIGHELGDGAYFMRRAPDLVVFCGTSGRDRACSRGGKEMQADPRFEQQYELVSFVGRDPIDMVGRVYVRSESPLIGIERSPEAGRVRVPAWLAVSARPVELDANGAAGVFLEADDAIQRREIAIRPGTWTASLETGRPVVAEVEIRSSSDGAVLASGPAPLAFRVDDATPAIDVSATSTAPAHARAIVLRSVRDD